MAATHAAGIAQRGDWTAEWPSQDGVFRLRGWPARVFAVWRGRDACPFGVFRWEWFFGALNRGQIGSG